MALTAENDQSSSEPQPTKPTATNGGSRPRGKRGPKTAAGKQRISSNALTHGLSSARLILPTESTADWATFRQGLIQVLEPVGALEMMLAERVASSLWRLRRVDAYERAALDERQHLEQASARLLPHPADIDKIIRFETHLSRQFISVLHELEALQDARGGKPTPLLRVDVNNQTRALPDAESA